MVLSFGKSAALCFFATCLSSTLFSQRAPAVFASQLQPAVSPADTTAPVYKINLPFTIAIDVVATVANTIAINNIHCGALDTLLPRISGNPAG